MKGFILGTLIGAGLLTLAIVLRPERAQHLIDQAPDVRGVFDQVLNRLDQLEQRDATRTPPDIDPASSGSPPPRPPQGDGQLVSIVHTGDPNPSRPPEIRARAVDFDDLAAGLAKVSEALERLNRTMRPGTRSSTPPVAGADGASS